MKLVLELSIREYCKSKQLSEGIIDKVVGHVFNILHKSNDKRAEKALVRLAKSSPEGAKAVKNGIELKNSIERAGKAAQQDMDDIRKKYNLKYV